MAESLAQGYDRYFLSLRSPKTLPGWAALDGKKMRRLRKQHTTDLAQYQGIIADGGIFFAPKVKIPSILNRVETLIMSVRAHAPQARQQMREAFGIPTMTCRSATIHRNGWRAVLRAAIVVEDDTVDLGPIIHRNRRRLVRTAKRWVRRETKKSIARLLPIGYVYLTIFNKDYRRRRLATYGLGDDLVCTVTLHRISRIKHIDILGSTVETFRKWRIAWNKAWLDKHRPLEVTQDSQ